MGHKINIILQLKENWVLTINFIYMAVTDQRQGFLFRVTLKVSLVSFSPASLPNSASGPSDMNDSVCSSVLCTPP